MVQKRKVRSHNTFKKQVEYITCCHTRGSFTAHMFRPCGYKSERFRWWLEHLMYLSFVVNRVSNTTSVADTISAVVASSRPSPCSHVRSMNGYCAPTGWSRQHARASRREVGRDFSEFLFVMAAIMTCVIAPVFVFFLHSLYKVRISRTRYPHCSIRLLP